MRCLNEFVYKSKRIIKTIKFYHKIQLHFLGRNSRPNDLTCSMVRFRAIIMKVLGVVSKDYFIIHARFQFIHGYYLISVF